jgi:regulator of protease activity HflC (stomatin/prohibitin superfamily)
LARRFDSCNPLVVPDRRSRSASAALQGFGPSVAGSWSGAAGSSGGVRSVEWLGWIVVLAIVVLVVVVAARSIRLTTIHDYQRGLRFRQGRLVGLVDPGVHLTVRPLVELQALDVRPAMVPVEGQEILTADGVAAKVSLVARYVVGDPVAAITRDADFRRTTYLLLQLGLRQAVSHRTLDETIAARSALGPEVREAIAGRLAEIGVELLDVEVRDVMLPGELKRAFASVIAARKEGEASLERARAETAALRGLANAGRTLADNPGLLQLRILQEIGASSGNTVVFGAGDGTIRPGDATIRPGDGAASSGAGGDPAAGPSTSRSPRARG